MATDFPEAAVDEDWPTHGWPGAAYTREKAYLERYLDSFEREDPDVRLVRLRPGFLFEPEAACEQRRLFGRCCSGDSPAAIPPVPVSSFPFASTGLTPAPVADRTTGCTLTVLRASHPRPARILDQLDAIHSTLAVEPGPAPALTATLDTRKDPVDLRR